ncbi:MAG TPA: thioredoxin family protein [Cyclobacteriaceae bacterium]|nr:thioredoxin family protein [Cyclobacteriaceae bacterium]
MAVTSSPSVNLGSSAPEFRLMDAVTHMEFSLGDLKGRSGTVILFICNHCPYVRHVDNEIVRLAQDFQSKGIHFVAISSNDASQYPEDGPDNMKLRAEELGYPFPYLYDESQDVARLYNAVCTPDIFVYDDKLRLVYHGQIDDSRPKNVVPVTGKDIRAALKNLLDGKPISPNQTPSIGCSIKWKN